MLMVSIRIRPIHFKLPMLRMRKLSIGTRETNAIFNALKLAGETPASTSRRYWEFSDLNKMTLYVARAKHTESLEWTWGNSKPCTGCMSCLYKYDIRRIVYSMDEIGHYGVINA